MTFPCSNMKVYNESTKQAEIIGDYAWSVEEKNKSHAKINKSISDKYMIKGE